MSLSHFDPVNNHDKAHCFTKLDFISILTLICGSSISVISGYLLISLQE